MLSSLANQQIVVTGGCGFIGSHLVASLCQQQVKRVVVLDEANPVTPWPSGTVFHVRGQLGAMTARDLDSILDGVHGVFHLAARKHRASALDADGLWRSNVIGTHHLLDAARRTGVSKFVFASSLYTYGRMTGAPFVEELQPAPNTIYGISKLTGEMLVRHYAATRELPGVSLRFFFAYGPGQTFRADYPSVITRSFRRLARGEPPIIHGSGQQRLDYIHVQDIVDAMCRIMTSPLLTGVFNVGSGHGVSIRELTSLMQKVAETDFEPVVAPADETEGSSRVADINAIRSALGWQPRRDLAGGLAETWQTMLASEGACQTA